MSVHATTVGTNINLPPLDAPFKTQVAASIRRLERLQRGRPLAVQRGVKTWAEDVNDMTNAAYHNHSNLYRIAREGDDVLIGWKLVYIPWFLEAGTRPHWITANAIGKDRLDRMSGAQLKMRRTQQAALRRQEASPGGRKGKWALYNADAGFGPVRWAKHPGTKGKWFVRKTVTSTLGALGSQIRSEINLLWWKN